MEASLILLALLVLGGPWLLAALAFRAARRARSRAEALELRVSELAAGLSSLRDELRGARGASPEAARPEQILPTEAVPPAPAATSPAEAPGPAPASPPEPVRGWGPLLAPAAAPTAPAAPAAQAAGQSLEEKVALVWFARIGALVFLLGAAYFFKYAVDNEWIGPMGRVALGAAAGAAALGAAEAIRARAKALYVHAVLGTGVALLFVSAYAAAGLYHLLPTAAAFAAVAVIAVLGGALALRHRAELVLLLSLLGGLMAPVLLSTGEDRPLALFGYLLLLTGLALFASARAGFAIAPWLALAGTAALFAGWHARFFDVSPPGSPPAPGLPPSYPAGDYHALVSRAVPLLFAALFAGSFAAAGLAAHRRQPGAHRRQPGARRPPPFLVVALSLAHLAFASLLHDRAAALGAALALLGLGSAAVLERAGRGEWLAVPLLVSFLALLASARNAGGSPLPAAAVLAVWAALYAGSFVRQARRAAEGATARGLALAGGAGIAFTLVAGVLLRDQPLAFALVAVAVGAVYALLAALHRAAPLLAGAVAVSFAAVLFTATRHPGLPVPGLLGAGLAWAVVHLAASAHALLLRREEPTPLRVAVASAPGLGLLALAILLSGPEESILRAAVAGAGAAADLALGGLLLRRARRPAAVLLGQALGLAAAAAAFLLSGASVTLAWAALAAVAGALAAAEEDRDWLALAGLLFLAALLRAALVDFRAPALELARFLADAGRSGSYRPSLLWNPRALSFAGTAAALGIAAWRSSRSADPVFRKAAGAMAAAAHALLLALAVLEVRSALFPWSAPPAAGDEVAFRAFARAHATAARAQVGRLGMFTTLVLGAYASGLVAAGFAAREALHRWLGLALFAATLAKLALWDVWKLARGQQVAVLLGVGALLLAAAFLYARFGQRLLGILRGGGAVLLLALPSLAAPLDPAPFAQAAQVEGVAAPGLWRFEVPPALFRASRAGHSLSGHRLYDHSLYDIRLAGPDGAEVAWLLRETSAPPAEERRLAAILDPVTLPDGAVRALLDLGRSGLRHGEVRLELAGEEFLRRVRVESSDDGRTFGLLAESGRVFAVAGHPEHSGRLRYPTSAARYLRVTLLPGAGRVAIAGAAVLDRPSAPPPPPRRLPVAIAAQARDEKAKRTFLDLDLGGSGLPAQAVVLETAAPAFERRVRVHWSEKRDWFVAGSGGVVWRTAGGPPEDRESLRLALGPVPPTVRWIRLEIEDRDDAPIAWTGAALEWRPREIVFRAERAGPHTLLVGAEGMEPPGYDLAAVLLRAPAAAGEASLGPLAANPRRAAPAPVRLPFTERYRTPLAVALALLLALLALWSIRLLRHAGKE